MGKEKRQHVRVTGPFDGTWSGAVGQRVVRIVDISHTGCFVDDIASPAMGERVTVTVRLPGEQAFELPGEVRYTDAVQGFAVEFDQAAAPMPAFAEALERLIASRVPHPPS